MPPPLPVALVAALVGDLTGLAWGVSGSPPVKNLALGSQGSVAVVVVGYVTVVISLSLHNA